jgi:hypothetical protein
MSRPNLRRGAVFFTCFIAATAIVAAPAGATPKGGFTPEEGTFKGTYALEGSHPEVLAGVRADSSGKWSVDVSVPVPVTCDGEPWTLLVSVEAPVKGRTFKYKGKVGRASNLINNLHIDVDLKGHFTSRTAFKATVEAKTAVEPGNSEVTVACSGPPLTLPMKWSGG